MIGKIAKNQSHLYSLFIPIIEQLDEKSVGDDYKRILIKYIPQYGLEIKHEFKDVAINQIKIFGLISLKSGSILNDPLNKDGQSFIQYLIKCVSSYLKERFSVYVKRETFNLICLIAHFPVSNYGKQKVYDTLQPSLNYVKKLHFPLRSREIKNTNEGKNF